jgi:hypothetical protein
MKQIITTILIFSVFVGKAQLNKVLKQPPYYIKTVQLNDGKLPKPSAIIPLNFDIYLSFDDLQADEKEYYYKIIRYNEEWKLSDLAVSEYISGFDSNAIEDIENSIGTLQTYTHYALRLPNDNTKIILSGNYILQVLDDEDEVVFSKPFILYEKKINIGIQVKWANDVTKKDQWQAVDFSIYKSSFSIMNETEALTARIFQNSNIFYSKEFHQPTFYKGDEWVYHYPNDAVFEGINEFRQFETKDLRGVNYGIYRSELNNLYDFYPYEDDYRTHYLFHKDINGSYIINTLQGEDMATEADYTYIHFVFNNSIENDKKLYVIGRFNDFNPTKDYELTLNNETEKYEAAVLLKQGYYNYMYVTKDQSGQIDVAEIGGSFAQTENDYSIIVYYRSPGARYARAIGYGKANSDRIK